MCMAAWPGGIRAAWAVGDWTNNSLMGISLNDAYLRVKNVRTRKTHAARQPLERKTPCSLTLPQPPNPITLTQTHEAPNAMLTRPPPGIHAHALAHARTRTRTRTRTRARARARGVLYFSAWILQDPGQVCRVCTYFASASILSFLLLALKTVPDVQCEALP